MTRPLLACALTILAATSATSTFAADAASKGDVKAGKALVYTCGGCHGVTGYMNAYPNYHVPRIAGQNYDYLVAALTEYRARDRVNTPARRAGFGDIRDDFDDHAG